MQYIAFCNLYELYILHLHSTHCQGPLSFVVVSASKLPFPLEARVLKGVAGELRVHTKCGRKLARSIGAYNQPGSSRTGMISILSMSHTPLLA